MRLLDSTRPARTQYRKDRWGQTRLIHCWLSRATKWVGVWLAHEDSRPEEAREEQRRLVSCRCPQAANADSAPPATLSCSCLATAIPLPRKATSCKWRRRGCGFVWGIGSNCV